MAVVVGWHTNCKNCCRLITENPADAGGIGGAWSPLRSLAEYNKLARPPDRNDNEAHTLQDQRQ